MILLMWEKVIQLIIRREIFGIFYKKLHINSYKETDRSAPVEGEGIYIDLYAEHKIIHLSSNSMLLGKVINLYYNSNNTTGCKNFLHPVDIWDIKLFEGLQ